MAEKNPKVDALLERTGKWREEFGKLRKILLGFPLTEAVKWGQPCYSLGKGNVVLMHGFKDYCALLFFKGALLEDPEGILIRQTDNVQAARQVRFADARAIGKLQSAVKALVRQAIAAEQAGLKVKLKKTSQFPVPAEFRRELETDSALSKAFAALTPGRQRAYLLHFAGAKQSRTREARIEKCRPRILDGIGLND